MIRCNDGLKKIDYRVASPFVHCRIFAGVMQESMGGARNHQSFRIQKAWIVLRGWGRASLSSTSLCCQSARTPRGKDTHDAEDNIEQSQRIRHQAPHATHARHGAEHPRRAIGAPSNSSRSQEIPEHRVHGEKDANETGQHQRQETVAQDASRAWESKCGGEVAGGRRARHGGLVMRVVVGGIGGVWCGGGIEGRRHEAEDKMQGNSAENSDTIDVAVEDLAGEEEEGAVQDDVE